MKWTIRVELTPDGNPPITYDIGTITRPIADLSPEQIGLTLEEGQQLLRRVQVQIIGSQAHAYALCRQPCVECGRPKRIKDIRTKCVQTVFGAFRFRGRRYRACGCRGQSHELRQEFPLGEIIPRRTTPEVRYLFAELGAGMPYRAASRVLKTCGFGNMRASHMTIRRHTLAIGRELEAQRLAAAVDINILCCLFQHQCRQRAVFQGLNRYGGAESVCFAVFNAAPYPADRDIDC